MRRCPVSLIGLLVGRKILPLGTADRTEQYGVGRFAGFDDRIGHRVVVRIDGGAAGILFRIVEGEAGFFCNGIEYFDGFRNYFGADAVARQQGDIIGFGHISSFV